jgi:hypothetical protein
LALKARAEVEAGAERARTEEFSTAVHMPGAYDAGERWGRYSAYERATEMVEAIAVRLDTLAAATSIDWAKGAYQHAAQLVREGEDGGVR